MDWLQAKLDATDVTALLTDYDFLLDDEELGLVRDAIRLSAHILASDKTQLRGQLLGRLMSHEVPEIQTLLERAKQPSGGTATPVNPQPNTPQWTVGA